MEIVNGPGVRKRMISNISERLDIRIRDIDGDGKPEILRGKCSKESPATDDKTFKLGENDLNDNFDNADPKNYRKWCIDNELILSSGKKFSEISPMNQSGVVFKKDQRVRVKDSDVKNNYQAGRLIQIHDFPKVGGLYRDPSGAVVLSMLVAVKLDSGEIKDFNINSLELAK